jgi:hypothetical protein
MAQCGHCDQELPQAIEHRIRATQPKAYCNAVCRGRAYRKRKATAILTAIARIETRLQLLSIEDTTILSDLQAIKDRTRL